ncbi:MAG: Na+/H+ antiporter NhaA [Deltaproteobacteria bacterium]|nr:Na+/H+ antiporter NhaA [Deltaproteobacteria bacterium]
MSDDLHIPLPIDRLVRPFRVFAKNKLAGAILLMITTVIAIFWANSPWSANYHDILMTEITLGIGDFVLSKTLLHWINDGLMDVFFFVVGLEIKREILAGELSSVRKAVLPISAALGGMLVPAGLFLVLNLGGEGQRGWGIPMATDIAFALGVLALLGSRVPIGLKVFLTALAIVDDIGAILVIAFFYADTISIVSLAAGGILLIVAVAANRSGVRSSIVYFILGTLVWFAFLKSGIHATLAAVLMAMTIPAKVRIRADKLLPRMSLLLGTIKGGTGYGHPDILTKEQQQILSEMGRTLEKATAPLQQLEHALVPLVTFFVLPVFALANAGVTVGHGLSDALGHSVSIGIILGLFLGKQAGVLGFSWLAVKLGLADLPDGVGWRQIHGVSVLAGIGFTMSLFIAGLAFNEPGLQDISKVGVFAASVLSGVVGWVLLRFR